MKIKRHIVIDGMFVLFMLIGAFFGYASYSTFSEKDIGIGTAFAVLAAVSIISPLIIAPCCYIFDCHGISIHYLFLTDERYLWENIHSIRITSDSHSYKSILFEMIVGRVYSISGQAEGPIKRYMKGYVRKSFRAKRLIKKYWDGEITGGLFEKRRKKEAEKKTYLTDEVTSSERELRSKAKEWTEPYKAEAKLYGLDICCKFVYINEDYDESNSRPKEAYTYTVLAEIAHPGETDDGRIIALSVDLLYVRLGKTAVKGSINKSAEKELRSALTSVLSDIKENGFDSYLEEV